MLMNDRSPTYKLVDPLPNSVANCKQGSLRAVRYNVDGEYVLTCGADRSVKLWNGERGALISSYLGHSGDVLDARGSCDNSQIVSGSTDKNVALWDVATKRMVRRFRGHNAAISSILFNEESTLIISGSQDNTVKFWDTRSKSQKEIQTLEEPGDAVTSMAITNHSVLVGSADGWTRLYDLRQGQLSSDCMGEAVTSVSISRDMASHLVSIVTRDIRLIDKETGQLLASYSASEDYKLDSAYKTEVAFDFSDRIVIGGGYSKVYGDIAGPRLYFWDLITQNLVAVGMLNTEGRQCYPVTSVCPHPTKPLLIAAAGSGLWVFSTDESDLSK